jgi:dTDP-4-dehydrorhamnose 3,5-epimerase
MPENVKALGDLILSPTSPKLIPGMKIAPVALWPDDRGYFLEIQRLRQGLAADFPHESSQVSAALNYPGTIKAFHIHFSQTDCWTPVMGMMQVVLVRSARGVADIRTAEYDLCRPTAALADFDSATRGARL